MPLSRRLLASLLARRGYSSSSQPVGSLFGSTYALGDLPGEVRIVEVGPRDGLQNEQNKIPTEAKIKFIDLLTSAGLRSVESTSFVSPKRVPQLADAAEVVQGIRRGEGVRYAVLVPNMKAVKSCMPLAEQFIRKRLASP